MKAIVSKQSDLDIYAGGSLLSPLVKSLVADNEPPAVGLRGRTTLMHRIENRFRFLAVSFLVNTYLLDPNTQISASKRLLLCRPIQVPCYVATGHPTGRPCCECEIGCMCPVQVALRLRIWSQRYFSTCCSVRLRLFKAWPIQSTCPRASSGSSRGILAQCHCILCLTCSPADPHSLETCLQHANGAVGRQVGRDSKHNADGSP